MISNGRNLANVLADIKKLAIEYFELTGRPLGVTGEIGEFEAARLLNLKLAPVREAGFDAQDASGRKLQIKARAFGGEGERRSQRVGAIKINHQWDAVLLVLMNGKFETQSIYEADRTPIVLAITAPGSRARNERGALAVSKFKAIGKQVWPHD